MPRAKKTPAKKPVIPSDRRKSRSLSQKPASERSLHAASPERSRGSQDDKLSAPVVGVDGKTKGRIALPPELFAANINKQLLAQSVRVYLANQRRGTASTKTRGEVEGSTRKIFRQKGTGRARHGAIRAPIFVGGGIIFGPKFRDYSLGMPKKMQRQALAAALTSVREEGHITVVDGLSELAPKTKHFAAFFRAIGAPKRTLLVVSPQAHDVIRGARNVWSVDIMTAQNLNPYAILSHQQTVLMKEAVLSLRKTQRDAHGAINV